MNTNPSNLALFMNIDMNRYYKYLEYRLPWVIVHLASLNNKLVTCYLRLLRSVNHFKIRNSAKSAKISIYDNDNYQN